MNNSLDRIAVVGIAGVFPSATTLDAFWSVIADGHSTARQVPRERWSIWPDRFDGEAPTADAVASRHACLIEPFAHEFDGLQVDPEIIESLDPMYRLLLHTGRSAWADVATAGIEARRAGIVIGSIALPTDAVSRFSEEVLSAAFMPAAASALGLHVSPASLPRAYETLALNRQVCGLPAALLARALGIGGFAYTLDAACASSLYAIKLAAQALQERRLDAVITGGLSRPDSLYTQMGFSQLRALSPSGRCAPFDRRADGLVVGEGCGLLVLKRLEDALAHGDTIHGLIAGVGLSNDLGANLMSPNSEGQLRAMRDAYRGSGWHPREVDLVECHGTGTPVGDAVEFESMRAAWNGECEPASCVMGSVKSNVGHLLTAAGAAGVIKVLLAMREQTLPPTANFESQAARVTLSDSPFRILNQKAPWARRDPETPRRAAVSAFGFGGVNAHLLVEEYVARPPRARSSGASTRPPKSFARGSGAVPAVAIVGIGAHFGPFKQLDAFRRQMLGDAPQPPNAGDAWYGMPIPKRFRGYRVDDIDIPASRFRIPPAEIREMLPQQLIMLEVAAAAFDDASQDKAPKTGDRVGLGVYLGIGLDLDTTNFHFRWNLIRRLKQAHPDLDDEWLVQVRDVAHPPLTANRTMGALGSIAASRLARAFRAGGP
ncbi:MAG TPA: beta-ketoacyl synthase N-terminal-like domain-containing protein, partial [Gammaproteobacteria bacterium]